MRISEILENARRANRPVFSFEFYPPKNEAGLESLQQTLLSLRPLKPDFCSVTCGAGGSTRALTLDIVSRIKREVGIEPMAHLTCAGASREELRRVLHDVKAQGVENVLALRGDPPKGSAAFTALAEGFSHAHELAAMVRDEFQLCVGGACYPEGHPETRDHALNVLHTRLKVLAGCEFLITQLFFDPTFYFDFVAKLRGAGVYTPVLPGIMPITDEAQIDRMTKMCGASIPETLRDQMHAAKGDPMAMVQLGIAFATHQCSRLLAGGAPGIHFYTLNRSPSTRAILAALRASYPA